MPRDRAQNLLTLAPGILLTNHGGEGHTASMYQRGFDAGEGEDIELRVDEVPLNEVSNYHGHGYADVTFLMPEVVSHPFELGHTVDIDDFTCTSGDGTSGIVVPVNGTAEAEITWHVTHLWFDSFAEDSAFRAEAVAAVYDGKGPVTMEQLASQPLGNLRDRMGKPQRDSGGNPVIYIPSQEPGVNTPRDFAVRARFGHFNGLNGACETEVRVR